MASIRETFNKWLVFYLLLILAWLAVLVMGVAEEFSEDIAFMAIVKEICSSSVFSYSASGRRISEFRLETWIPRQ